MRFGLHVSIGKGITKAVDAAVDLGCDCFQIFAGNPRGWRRTPLNSSEVKEFRKNVKSSGLGPIVVHLSYLPNPASDNQELYEKSIMAIGEDYRRAIELGADFFVVHPGRVGKGKDIEEGISRVAAGIRKVLSVVQGNTLFLLENQAGAGSEIAGKISELGRILKEINSPERMGICLDTCHAFAAGYDLSSQKGIDELLSEIDDTVDLSSMPLLHLNDAVGEVGSHLDRHANIGEGNIGKEGFRLLFSDPRVHRLAGILETPRTSDDDDRRNLAILRELFLGGEK
jgi:deoxyribonuclease-4